MERIYKIPIMGAVIDDRPLKGMGGNPLCAIPLDELPGYNMLTIDDSSFSYVAVEYNVDEEWVEIELEASDGVHNWLLGLVPQLKSIAKSKGWTLDKTELEKTRKARELG